MSFTKEQLYTFATTPQPLTEEQRIAVSIYLKEGAEMGDVSQKDILGQLGGYFETVGFRTDRIAPVAQSHWRWFVDLFWDHLGVFPDSVTMQAVAATCVDVASRGVLVRKRYTSFLIDRASDFPKFNMFHIQLREHLKKMSLMVPQLGLNPYISIADLVGSIEQFEANDHSTDRAELLAQLEKNLFPTDAVYTSVERRELVASLVTFIRIVLFIDDAENIARREYNDELEAYAPILDPEVFATAIVANLDPVYRVIGDDTFLDEMIQPFNLFLYFEYLFQVPFQEWSVDRVVAELDELATNKENPRIRDVYYFNEQTNQFEWDEALLKELKLIPPDFDMSTIAK